MTKLKYAAVALLVCCILPVARANSIITSPGAGSPNVAIGNTTVGFDFTVGSTPLSVSALGLWDQSRNGFTNSHNVGLWDISGNLLAQVSLSAGTTNPLTGDFRYVTLAAPVTLLAGTTYVLGATYINADLDRVIVNVSGNQATFDSAVLAGNFRQIVGPTSLSFPNANIQPGSAVGPNAIFSPIATPEGGPGVLFIATVLGVLLLLHRQISSASRKRRLG